MAYEPLVISMAITAYVAISVSDRQERSIQNIHVQPIKVTRQSEPDQSGEYEVCPFRSSILSRRPGCKNKVSVANLAIAIHGSNVGDY